MLLKILDKLRLIFEKRKIGKSSAERKTKTIESTIFTKMIRIFKNIHKLTANAPEGYPRKLQIAPKIANCTQK